MLPETEDTLHRSILDLLRRVLPADTFGPWHTPNGEARAYHVGARLAGLGTTPGMPDLMFVHAGRLHCLEVKTHRGRLTPAQIAVCNGLIAAGARFAVVRSVEEARAALDDWHVPTRLTRRIGGRS